MSASKFNKKVVFIPLLAAVLAGGYFLLRGDSDGAPASVASQSENDAVQHDDDAKSAKVAEEVAEEVADKAAEEAPHASDCTHCQKAKTSADAEPRMNTQPDLDYIFKGIAAHKDRVIPKASFDFFHGSRVGDSASVQIADLDFSGKVSVVRENHELARTYGMALEDGSGALVVSTDGGGFMRGHLLFLGDSRAITFQEVHIEGIQEPSLVFFENKVSDIFCAAPDAVYTGSGVRSPTEAGAAEYFPGKNLQIPTGPVDVAALESLPDAEFVLYLDFDGETVTNTPWNLMEVNAAGEDISSIVALPQPRADEDEWVRLVWSRVVEDFIPFNLNVTTDRSVFDAADPDKRLQAIITSTRTVTSMGGVAMLHSFRGDSPIVWVINSGEAECADTISHEAGHAFGLEHDGQEPATVYYGGHNFQYAPGWAPIMGGFFADGIVDEVTQWSMGEYTNADNQEDDISIIADDVDPQEGVDVVAFADFEAQEPALYDLIYSNGLAISNGFGFKADDIGATIGGTNLGTFTVDANTMQSFGCIETENDVDLFEFTATDGPLRITVSPLDVSSIYSEFGSETSGANLALRIQLLDETGNPAEDQDGQEIPSIPTRDNLLSAFIEADIDGGTYYLSVEGDGRGTALRGFSDYGSLGQYVVFGELPLPDLAVDGGPKQEVAVFNGDISVKPENGTDFGFTVPSGTVSNTFMLKNEETVVPLEDISISLASGAHFRVGTPLPESSITPGGQQEFTIIYDPNSTGAHGDTVRIEYEAGGSQVFEFAVRGVTTASSTRDNYEDNDYPLAINGHPGPHDLTLAEDLWLSQYRGPAFFLSDVIDYYSFTTKPGDKLVEIDTFNMDWGDLTFELLYKRPDVQGVFIPAVSSTSIAGVIRYLIPESLNPSTSSIKFIIRVTSGDAASVRNEYDLRWSAIPLIADGDDLYEENDTQDQAYDLTNSPTSRLSQNLGLGVSNDEDWYKIEVPSNPYLRMLYVAAEFDHTQGNIDVEVIYEDGNFEPNNNFASISATENDKEVVTYGSNVTLANYVGENRVPEANNHVMGLVPGTYYIRVYGNHAGNSYDLVVETLMEDNYEVIGSNGTENDSMEDAYDLGDSIIGEWLSNLDGAGTAGAYLSDPDDLDATFTNAGDIDWYSFDLPSGVEELALQYRSIAESPSFSIIDADTGEELTETRTDGVGELRLFRPSAGTYLIRVVSFQDIANLSGYDFRVSATFEPVIVQGTIDDNYEQNDMFYELYNLSNNEGRWLSGVDGYGFQLDPDWYEIAIPRNAAKLVATIYHESAEGDMDLYLSTKEGPLHFVADEGGDVETITWENPIPGEYGLTVVGANRGNLYNLFWEITFSEDKYEENDVRADATDLTGHERRFLSKLDGAGIQKDEDWYRITADADTVELQASVTFTHNDGDIDLALYNVSGSQIQRSISTDNNESITYPNPAPGDYYLRVYYGNAGNEYDLTWAALSQAELDATLAPDDAYEVNNSANQPYLLTAEQPRLSALDGLGVQLDDDWYEIEVPDGNSGLRIECLFTDAEGDIDFEVYDPYGYPIGIRDSITDNELLHIDRPVPAGTYQIHVYGPGLGNEYDLYWTAFLDDIYEDNDTLATAYDLSQEINRPLLDPTLGDEDWYCFEAIGPTPFIQVEMDYIDLNGAIDFQILDASGTVLATADSTNDSEFVLLGVNSGTYYVRVYGENLYNGYDMTISVIGDDQYEENDVLADAADITATPAITAVQFDTDWFWFEVTQPDTFLSVIATFTHASGNIDLALYRQIGPGQLMPVDVSMTAQNGEGIRVPGDAGIYYVEVTGDGVNPNYQLLWTVDEDDQYEENDELADATDLTLGDGDTIDAIQFDEDWFEVLVQPGNVRLEATLDYLQAEGNLNMTLYDVNGVELAFADTDTDNEELVYALNPFDDGGVETYYIKVSGVSLGTAYRMTWLTSTEDDFEGEDGNNIFDEPSDVLIDTEGQRISSTIGYGGALNDDWYEVRINPDDDGIVVEAFFIHTADDNIDLELYSQDEVFLGRSVGESNVERIHYEGPAGTYYLRIFGASNGNPYDLIWNSYKEDNLEKTAEGNFQVTNDTPENDTPDNPRGLRATEYNENFYEAAAGWPNLEYRLLEDLTQLDEEWYAIRTFQGEDILTINLEFEHSHGDIDVAVYDRDAIDDPAVEALIAQAETETDGEQIIIRDLPAGDYLICVYGYGIVTPKSDPAWAPGDFNPLTDDLADWADYESIQENVGDDFYDLEEEHARGLGNTYSLRWISTSEDIYDEEDPDLGVNDTLDNAAVPVLEDPQGIIDAAVVDPSPRRQFTTQNDEGELVTVSYRPVYKINDLAQFDEDWFEIPVDIAGAYDFNATMYFNTLHGNLDLYLYSANGALIDAAISPNGYTESVTVSGVGAATYYLRVVGNDLGVPYDLEVRAFFDDDYEDNDTNAEADVNAATPGKDLSDKNGVEIPGLVSQDVDIYRIEVPPQQVHLVFEIESNNGGVALGTAFDLSVLDSAGNELPAGFELSGGSEHDNDNESSGVISPEGGIYYLRVGATSGLSYNLLWSYNNIDQYEVFVDPLTFQVILDNNTALTAEDLTRFRLEPLYIPDAPGPLDPIKEFAFDYDLINGLTLGAPSFDPFGHATQTDDDWYAIQIPSWFFATARRLAPNNDTFQVLKRDYYVRLWAEIEFSHIEGDINLEIYDETDLLTPLARSETANDTEELFARIDPTDEDRFYYLRVYGDNAGNVYTLKWDALKQDAYEELEDNFEDELGNEFNTENDTNNFVDKAFDLTDEGRVFTENTWLDEIEYLQDVNGDGTINALDGGFTAPGGYGMQTTDDWYTVVVSQGSTQIEVECRFYSDNDVNYRYDPDDLDMDFEVYFLAGNDDDPATNDLRRPVLIGRSTENTNPLLFAGTGQDSTHLPADITTPITETATFNVDEPGIYFIRVYYDNRAHPYTFRWDDIGDADNTGDAAIINDFLHGNWSFQIPDELPGAPLIAPGANADGDRFPNWAEHALGLDTSVADYAVIGQSIAEIEGEQYYQFEFLRNREAEALGYEFIVQESESLVFDDDQKAVHVRNESIPGNLELERAIYRCSTPMDEQDKCFFRLVVNEPNVSTK